MGDINVKVEHKVTEKDIADLLITAWEGGSSSWIEAVRIVAVPSVIAFQESPNRIYKKVDYPLNEGGVVRVTGEGEKPRDLNRQSIEKGLQVMAEKYPLHFTDFIKENYDATTADVFLQCCLFGEVVYG